MHIVGIHHALIVTDILNFIAIETENTRSSNRVTRHTASLINQAGYYNEAEGGGIFSILV